MLHRVTLSSARRRVTLAANPHASTCSRQLGTFARPRSLSALTASNSSHRQPSALTSSSASSLVGQLRALHFSTVHLEPAAAAAKKVGSSSSKKAATGGSTKKKAAKPKAKKAPAKKKPKKKAAAPKKPAMHSKLKPPKAPRNAWSIFLGEYIEKHSTTTSSGEKVTAAVLSSRAAPEYRALSSSERAVYERQAADERAAYPDKLSAWMKTLTPEMIREENAIRARRRKAKLSNKRSLKLEGTPKRPLSAFMRFTVDVRSGNTHPGLLHSETNVVAQSRLIAQAWKELPAGERESYDQAAKDDFAAYNVAKKEFEQSRA